MRIGVFGGSFDPPHSGHVQVARAAFERAKLDRVIWVPAFHPPHKTLPATPFEHRVAMVRDLIANELNAEVSEIESSLPPPSYTLQTLQALKKLHGTTHEWHLIIGADNWAIFHQWRQPDAVMREAVLVVYPRQGISLAQLPGKVLPLNCPEIPEESRVYRERMAELSQTVLTGLPVPVTGYIRAHGLYGFKKESLG